MNERSVVLGIADALLAQQIRALLQEEETREAGTATTASALRRLLDQQAPDVAFVDEGLGPLAPLELVRELTSAHPATAVVLVVREPDLRLVRAGMEAGARAVLGTPVSLEDFTSALAAAASWAGAVRAHLSGPDAHAGTRPIGTASPSGGIGRLVTVAGGRGGAGATTLVTLLALAVAGADHGRRRVCVIDLDLQTGDVATQLGVVPTRTVHDLVSVAEDLTARALEDTLFAHPLGPRVLFAPTRGELGEDVTGEVTRTVLGHARSRFDLVVVDAGAVMSEAATMAVEMADTALVVTTPDLPALRGTVRLLELWERLRVRDRGEVTVVLNRSSSSNEVTSKLVREVVHAQVSTTRLPARFRDLEPLVNSAVPDRVSRHPLWGPTGALAVELGLLPPRAGRWSSVLSRVRRPRRRPPPIGDGRRPRGRDVDRPDPVREDPRVAEPRVLRDAGQASLNLVIGFVAVAFLGVVAVQGLALGATAVLAAHGAGEGARRLAVVSPLRPEGRRQIEAAATGDLPQLWRSSAVVRVDGDDVEVRLEVPHLLGWDFFDVFRGRDVSMTAGTVRE